MEASAEIIGNPTALLIERVLYFTLGCFFVVALYKGIQRASDEKDL